MLSAGISGVRANDPCVASGATLVCQGNQTDGIDLTNTAFGTLAVNSLTAGIVTSGVPGIFFFTDTGGPLALQSDTGLFGISTTGDDAPGIWVNSGVVRIDDVPSFSSGDVTVSSHGTITTTGDLSYGLVVDSVTGLLHSTQMANSDGGNVLVSSYGSIVTYGLEAVGIDILNAVSAGTTAAGQIAASWGGDLTINSLLVETHGNDAMGLRAQQNVAADGDIAVGRGGNIVISNAGIVTTRGDGALGISAMSAAVARGADATAVGATMRVTSQDVETYGAYSPAISVAALLLTEAHDTGEARSGEFSVTSTGLISTHGDAAGGIYVTGIASALAQASVMNTARIDATRVDNTGTIVTRGDAAFGIVIQHMAEADVGHGGGDAAASVGAIVVNSNDIRTAGDGSVGIFVLSEAISATFGFGTASTGPITINSHNLRATGDASAGIFVQSSSGNLAPAGTAVSGDIEVNSSGVLAATGLDSVGIAADIETFGHGQASGDIAINILSGSVTGGSGAGAGVALGRSASSTVTNFGTISALSGTAIVGAGSVQAIQNYGTIIGNVDLGTGANAFNNHASGLFAAGALVGLGAGNTLTNAGVLAPGGFGARETTVVTGDLVQTASGRYAVDVDFGSGLADFVGVANAGGTASLAGTVVASAMPDASSAGFVQLFHILSADGGVTDDGLTAADTAVVDYSLIFDPNGQDVYLGAAIDFGGRDGGLNPNQTRIGQVLNAIQGGGTPASMGPAMAALMNVATTADLRRAYDQLSPESFAHQQTEAQVVSEDFSNTLMSCREAGGPHAAIREGECLWARARASDVDIAGSQTNIGSKSRIGSFAAGLQVAMAADWRVGVALGYDLVSRSTQSGASTDGDRTNIGAVVKYNPGPFLFTAGAAAGWGAFETDRRLAFGGFAATATSKSDTDYATGWLQAAYLADQGHWYLKPLIEARVTELDFSGAREAGGGGLGLVVSGSRDTMLSVSPALEVGTEFRFDALAVWRPFVRAGVTWRDEDAFVTQAAFAGAPLGVPGFQIVTDVDDVLFDVSAGVDVIGGDGAVLKVQYDGRFGSTLSQNSVSLKGSVPF